MTRKLLRPSLDQSVKVRPQSSTRRKPPEPSGAEASYLAQARDEGATLVLQLLSGAELKGSLEYYDRAVLKLVLDGGQRLMVRREQLKYYHAEREQD